MDGVRLAAGLEGLIVLAIIYFVLNGLQKAGEKARRSRPAGPPPPEPDEPTPTQAEGFSLEGILREIERMKQEREREAAPPPPTSRPNPPARRPAPPPRRLPAPARRESPPATARGPMGRSSRTRLPEAEDVEERGTLEGQSLEVEESLEILDETRLRPPPVPVDRDDEAERIVEDRIRAAEARNLPHAESDHRGFHRRVMEPAAAAAAAASAGPVPAGRSRASLRAAFIWREILGPPKALED